MTATVVIDVHEMPDGSAVFGPDPYVSDAAIDLFDDSMAIAREQGLSELEAGEQFFGRRQVIFRPVRIMVPPAAAAPAARAPQRPRERRFTPRLRRSGGRARPSDDPEIEPPPRGGFWSRLRRLFR